MASINKVILIGNLGRDPEVRHSQNGAAICNLTIATSRAWKDKASAERQEETEWHRVVLYDRLAEIAAEYLKKGGAVYIEGRLKTRNWTDKDGADKYTTEIVAQEMKLLGGRDSQDRSTPSSGRDQSSSATRAPRQTPHEDDREIPF